MPKRKNPLPTLPKVEYHGEVVVETGGKNGYKKVKKLGHGFQGACEERKAYTGIKKTAKEAAIALAVKIFKQKYNRESQLPVPEETSIILPNYDPGEPPYRP